MRIGPIFDVAVDWLTGRRRNSLPFEAASQVCEVTDIDEGCCCCCSPTGMSREVVERVASLHFGSVCKIDMTELRNPHRCEDLSDRYHWLLSKGLRESNLN